MTSSTAFSTRSAISSSVSTRARRSRFMRNPRLRRLRATHDCVRWAGPTWTHLHLDSGATRTIACGNVFVMIGPVPNTDWLSGCGGRCSLGERQTSGVEFWRRFGRRFGNPPISQRAALADLKPNVRLYPAFPTSRPDASDDLNASMKPRTRDGMWWRAGNTAQMARLTGSASCNVTSTRSPQARSSAMSQ